MSLRTVVYSSALMLLLSSCNDDDLSNVIPQKSVSGMVVNEHNQNVKVCLDYDKDGTCGEDEPSTFTNESGNYRLSNVNLQQASQAPRIAEITPDSLDYNDNPSSLSYRLYAPKDCDYISSLTSIIHHIVERIGEPENLANSKIQDDVITEQPLCSDYNANKTDPNFDLYKQNEYSYLMDLNDAFSGFMQQNLQAMNDGNVGMPSHATSKVLMHFHMLEMRNLAKGVTEFRMAEADAESDKSQAVSGISTRRFGLNFLPNNTFTQSLADIANKLQQADQARMEALSEILQRKSQAAPVDMLQQYLLSSDTENGLYQYHDKESDQGNRLSYRAGIADNKPSNINEEHYLNGRNKYFDWSDADNDFVLNDNPRADIKVTIPKFGEQNLSNQYSFWGYIPERGPFGHQGWIRLTPRIYDGAFGELSNSRIRLLHKNQPKGFVNFDYHPNLQEAYIETARAYDISGVKISDLLSLEPSLSIWNNIIELGSTFPEGSKAFSVNTQTASEFSITNKLVDSDDECVPLGSELRRFENVCYQVPALAPKVFGTPSLDLQIGIQYQYVEATSDFKKRVYGVPNTQPSFEKLIGDNDFAVVTLPIIAESSKYYVAAWISEIGPRLDYGSPLAYKSNDVYFFNIEKATLGDRRYYTQFEVVNVTVSDHTFEHPRPVTTEIKVSSRLYPTRLENSIGKGSWKRVNSEEGDKIIITPPASVKRMASVPSSITIMEKDGKLIGIPMHQSGELISSDQLRLGYKEHQFLLKSVDKEKVNLYSPESP